MPKYRTCYAAQNSKRSENCIWRGVPVPTAAVVYGAVIMPKLVFVGPVHFVFGLPIWARLSRLNISARNLMAKRSLTGNRFSIELSICQMPGATTAFLGRFPQVPLARSEEHTSELQSLRHLVCRLLLEKTRQATPRSPGWWGSRRWAARPVGGRETRRSRTAVWQSTSFFLNDGAPPKFSPLSQRPPLPI